MGKVSMPYLFSFLRYQTRCVIKFLTLRIIFNQPLKQWLAGEKRGEDENTETWISWEWKELFKWNKKHFS